MEFDELLKELSKLNSDRAAEIIAYLIHKCLPSKDNWRDYYYKYFPFWEKRGFHVTLPHYYSPLPEINKLDNSIWEKPKEIPNLKYNEDDQLKLLEHFSNVFRSEYENIPLDRTSDPKQYHLIGGRFEGIDGYILYCMIRHLKPKRVIEIGAGHSTLLTAQALQKNQEETGEKAAFISIEPYPNELLKSGIPGLTELIVKKLQDVDISLFRELSDGDILFIDSSHISKLGSDVNYEYIQILPKLNKGVMIHIHDIFTPYEYPKEFLIGLLFFFNEQYLLEAILANSDNYEVIWAGQYIYSNHFDHLLRVFPKYGQATKSPAHSSSLWLKKKH